MFGISNNALGESDIKKLPSHHFVALAKNQMGLKNLYRIVTASHIDHFYKTPRVTRSSLNKNRQGLLIGSACESGALFRAVLENKSWRELCDTAKYYDYLEIHRLKTMNF
jgi:DNA polymerase-3 subunit alpha (Gram-positive type)